MMHVITFFWNSLFSFRGKKSKVQASLKLKVQITQICFGSPCLRNQMSFSTGQHTQLEEYSDLLNVSLKVK